MAPTESTWIICSLLLNKPSSKLFVIIYISLRLYILWRNPLLTNSYVLLILDNIWIFYWRIYGLIFWYKIWISWLILGTPAFNTRIGYSSNDTFSFTKIRIKSYVIVSLNSIHSMIRIPSFCNSQLWKSSCSILFSVIYALFIIISEQYNVFTYTFDYTIFFSFVNDQLYL